MPDITNLPASGAYTGAANRAAVRAAVAELNRASASVRPLEYFGAVAVNYNATPTNNATACLDAIEWCADHGGVVIIGRGDYGVDGPLPLMSYANFEGVGGVHSRIMQLTAGQDLFTSTESESASIYGCRFANFDVHGGWVTNWTTALSASTGAAFRLRGRSLGPNDPIALAREDKDSLPDPHHVVENVRIRHVLGDGIVMTGRGEMQIRWVKMNRVSRYGIDCASPDNWFEGNTISSTGESSIRLTAGNQSLINEKYWFAGAHEGAEIVGAGLEISGAGVSNVVAATIRTQDTWGPGLVADGDSLIFSGNIDEAGGGRLEQQGGGWTGTRSRARSSIRLTTATRCNIIAGVNGGARTATAPLLVDIDGSGVQHNQIDVHTEGATVGSGRVRVSAGNSNAKRHNVVRENGVWLVGRVTEAQLADASHGVNTGGPTIVPLDPSGQAVRATDATWRVLTGATITPV